MTRPDWNMILKQTLGTVVICSCGRDLESQLSLRDHWQAGHFDYDEERVTSANLHFAHVELEAWHDLFKQLEAMSAITKEDAQSPAGLIGTPGLELIQKIKHWAYAYADLRESNPDVRRNER